MGYVSSCVNMQVCSFRFHKIFFMPTQFITNTVRNLILTGANHKAALEQIIITSKNKTKTIACG